MQLSARYRGRDDPFEGDRVVPLRALPAGAIVRRAVLTVTPARASSAPTPAPTFEELFVFGSARDGELAAADWGVTAATNDSTVEVDFHARRTLVAVTGARIQNSVLTVDVGGLYMQLNDKGTVLTPDDTNEFKVLADGVLPGVTVAKFRLAGAAAAAPAVDSVRVRSAPANVTVGLGNLGPFFTHIGELAAPEASLDFAETLQAFLTQAEAENGVYVLPFRVHADGIARLDLTLELEYLQGRSLLPDDLPEALLPFDLSTFARPDSGSLSARLPAGAQVVPGRTTTRLRGAFDSTRIAAGAGTGEATASADVVVAAGRAAAQAVEAAADIVATGFDLFLAALAPTVRLSLTLLGDSDGKPFGDPLLPKPLEVSLSREQNRAATWITVPLDEPFHVEAERRYWIVLQALEGEASWPVAASEAGAVPLQASSDGSLSWTTATDARLTGPLTALHRLRVTPAEFQMPIAVDVGSGDAKQRVSLRRFEPLGRVDLTLDTPELAHAFDAAAAAAGSGACPTGEHVLNGEFDDWVGVGQVYTQTRTITVEGSPRAVATAPDGRNAYVASFAAAPSSTAGSDRLLLEQVELEPEATPATIVLSDGKEESSPEPLALLLDPRGERAYVVGDLFEEGALSIADLGAGAAVGGPIDIDPYRGVALTPDGDRLLFLKNGAGDRVDLALLDTRLAERLAREGKNLVDPPQLFDELEIPIGPGEFLAGSLPVPCTTASRDGEALLAFAVSDDSGHGRVCLVRADDPTNPAFVAVGDNPIALAATADGRRIAVACGDKKLYVVAGDASTQTPASLPIADTPVALTLSADGSRAAVLTAKTVDVFDLDARRAVATMTVGNEPAAVAGAPGLDVILVAESTDGVARFATAAVPVEWTLTAGTVQPRFLGADLTALLGRPQVPAGGPTTPVPAQQRGPSAISQVVPVSGGCRYAFAFRALSDQPDSIAEVLWRGGDCGLERADRVPIAELERPTLQTASAEPSLVLHRAALEAPADAGQAEIRFVVPAGAVAAVGSVSLRGSDAAGVNEDLREVENGRPAGWSADPETADVTVEPADAAVRVANDGAASAALVQSVAVTTGPLEVELVGRTTAAGAGAEPRLEVRFVDAHGTAAGEPASAPLPAQSFDRVALVSTVPAGAARAEMRLELPSGAALELEGVTARGSSEVEVPVVFRAEAPGELAVAAAQVAFDVVAAPTPQLPETGVCPSTAPGDQPGAERNPACCCCGSHDTVEGDETAITAAGRPVILRRCASCGCRTVAVTGRPVPRAPVMRTSRPFAPPRAVQLRPAPPANVHALTEVPGIGRARARKLARVGIVSAERLAAADPGTVARILGHMTLRTATALTRRAVGTVTEKNPL